MRTEEQKAADEALTEAIERVARAYDVMQDGFMSQEYVVVMGLQSWNHQHDSADYSYCMVTRDGSAPGTRIIGLLDTASFDVKMGRESS